MNDWFDAGTLMRGLLVAVGLALPVTVLTAAADLDDGSPWAALSLVAVLAIFFAAGLVAGRLRPERAMSHGAVVGLLAFTVIQVLLLPVSLFSETGFETEKIPGLVFVAFLLSNVALVGGLLGSRLEGRHAR